MNTIFKYAVTAAIMMICAGSPAMAQNRDSNGWNNRGSHSGQRNDHSRQHSNRNSNDHRRPVSRPYANNNGTRHAYGHRSGYSNRSNYHHRPVYVGGNNSYRRHVPGRYPSYTYGPSNPNYPHYGPRYNWTRGERLHANYGGRVYVVNNYYDYDLRRPPHGYRWVRDDFGTYLLVAIATGVISDLIWNATY